MTEHSPLFEQFKKDLEKEKSGHKTLEFSDLKRKDNESWKDLIKHTLSKEKSDIHLGYGLHLMYEDNLASGSDHFDKYDGPFIPFPPSILENLAIAKEWDISLTDIIDRAAKMRRLVDIKQLGYLTFPEKDQTERYGKDWGIEKFPHDRFDHSFLTSVMNLSVLRISQAEGLINCSDKDILKSFIASTIHDSATVAGGDATKKISPEKLDEEKLVSTIMQNQEMQAVFRKNNLTKEDENDIQDIIFNQGPFGKLLDMVDKMSYTARDTQQVATSLKRGLYLTPEGKEILSIIDEDPNIYDILFDLRLDDKKGLYCTNPDKLNNVLKIRALMHNFIYLNPYSQMAEAAVIHPVLKKLMDSGDSKLSVENLLSQSDNYFEKTLCEALGDKEMYPDAIKSIRKTIKEKDVQVDIFPDYSSAETAIAELENQGRFICNVVNKTKGFKTSTDTLVEVNNKLIPFKEMYPDKDKEIQEIANRVKTVRVYHSKKPIV
ncbi:MAG TPA: hypothetical protein P5230_02120 [Candidatus Magasanikbacteria bacterium]|nr:hypothetical protein [Candidatus Magasanikbacteria bacterium]